MASVGDILRDTRIAQQHSIDDIAQATKIRSAILVAIENNQLDVLPSPYIKSFVKTYAQVLNITANEDIQSFLAAPASGSADTRTPPKNQVSAQQAKHDTSPSMAEQFAREKKSSPVNILVYSGLALGAMVLAYYFLWYEPQAPVASEQAPIPSVEPIDIQNSAPSPTIVSTVDSTEQQEEILPQDSLILEGITTAKVWISIVSDGKKSMQKLLDINTSYRWSADSVFTISLGNAGGIQFTLNGKPLPALGKEGAIVRNLHITRNGIASTGSPYTAVSGTRQRPPRQQSRTSSSIPSITPVEPKAQTPTLPRPEERPIVEH